jgi:hypothetical protein
MYLSSQAVSSCAPLARTIPEEEIAFWLSNGHYYDLVQKRWVQADFGIPRQIQDRIWKEASTSRPTSIRLQQKANDVMEMMASMSLTTSSDPSAIKEPQEIKLKRSAFATGRDKSSKSQRAHNRYGFGGVKVVETKHKSHRSHVKEKIKTLPPTLALNREFWRSVI